MRSPHCLCLFLLQNRKPKVNRTRDIPSLISSSISVRISFHISILASGFYFILFDSHSSSDLVSNSPLLWLICGTNVTGAHNFLRHSSLAEFIAPFSLLFIRENIYIYLRFSPCCRGRVWHRTRHQIRKFDFNTYNIFTIQFAFSATVCVCCKYKRRWFGARSAITNECRQRKLSENESTQRSKEEWTKKSIEIVAVCVCFEFFVKIEEKFCQTMTSTPAQATSQYDFNSRRVTIMMTPSAFASIDTAFFSFLYDVALVDAILLHTQTHKHTVGCDFQRALEWTKMASNSNNEQRILIKFGPKCLKKKKCWSSLPLQNGVTISSCSTVTTVFKGKPGKTTTTKHCWKEQNKLRQKI